MKNYELYIFRQGLNEANLKGAKFTYAVTKNKQKLEQEIKVIEKLKEPSKNMEKYEEERIKLNEEMANKDKKGKPIKKMEPVSPGRTMEVYDIPGVNDPEGDYQKKTKELREKHKKALDEHRKKMEEFNEFLNEESEFKPHPVSIDNVPEDIKQEQMDKIHWMIDEK